jgi:cytochrome b6-f complex iron-sulfur subunit
MNKKNMTEINSKESATKDPGRRPPAALGKADTENQITRRSFFSWLSIGWLAFIAATGGFFTMMLRFFFPNVLFEPVQTFRAGFPDDYTIGEVDLRWKNKYGVWIVRNNEGIYALSTTCTHLGCTPNWLNSEQKFKCPCHGSGFFKTGINFEGPAPRPLERFKISLADNGQIIVDKTIKFQQEKGQWTDPEAFLNV